jgi:cobalt transporter subunit CbtB
VIKTLSTVRNRFVADGLMAVLSADRAAAVLALLLGVFLIYGVGFAHADLLHNAAHDGRHAFAFPCH